jgi:UDP-N-acetylglucosamine transferase subunit ALG13
VILVTVGAQMPFDRLVRAVDAWAARTGRRDVLAQIGPGAWRPPHVASIPMLDPDEMRSRIFDADVVVSHAGMGTIITALELGRPLLVVPRRGDLRETRNDHQLATARAFEDDGRITVAWTATELVQRLDELPATATSVRAPSHASPELLETVRRFITTPVDALRRAA